MMLCGVMVVAGGCDKTKEITEVLNPVGWFETERAAASREIPGEDGDYPKITSMQQSPFQGDIVRDHGDIRESLVADRDNAQYSDVELRKMVPPRRIGVKADGVKADNDDRSKAGAADAGEAADADADSVMLDGDPSAEAAIANALALPQLSPPPTAQNMAVEQPEIMASIDRGVLTNHPLNNTQALNDLQRRSSDGGRLLANLVYPQNTVALTTNDTEILSEVVRFFESFDVKRLYIVGHASESDSTGFTSGLMTSYKLALDRATFVGESLAERGIPIEAIQIDSRGISQPLYSEATPNGVIGNRRVEVYVEF